MLKTHGALAALFSVVLCTGCGGSPDPSTVDGTTGSLFVDSTPDGASVFIDDVAEGFTPTTVASLDVGEHELRLELDGYETVRQMVEIIEGANEPLMIPLTPAAAQTGFLAVTTDPSVLDGSPVVAQVVLNGVPADGAMTNGDTAARVVVDTTRTWMVSVSLDGFLAVPGEHTCDPGATIPVAVPIGADVKGDFRASTDGRIVTVRTEVARSRVELHIVGEIAYGVSGNILLLPEGFSGNGFVQSDHNSFRIIADTPEGTHYDETFTRQ